MPELARIESSARGLVAIGLLLVALLFGGCSTNRFEHPREGTTQRGIASWYGEPFHGRATASGEIYDMHGMTAAHKDLPLGTVVDVTNLENGRQVRVRVNDRGPFVRGRILDLSYAAAREVRMIGPGTAKIELEVVRLGGGRSGPAWTQAYTVQIGAFRERDNAVAIQETIAARLAGDGDDSADDVRVVDAGSLHKVQVGRFRHRPEAEEMRRTIRRLGYSALIVPAG
ncbi:MAG: septal ring lytic transglycosylase RlpA family protein [Acidobacteriota bacterium]